MNAYFVKAGQVIRMEQRPGLHNGRMQVADVLFVTPVTFTSQVGWQPTDVDQARSSSDPGRYV
jgi:hypothetical protein